MISTLFFGCPTCFLPHCRCDHNAPEASSGAKAQGGANYLLCRDSASRTYGISDGDCLGGADKIIYVIRGARAQVVLKQSV